MNHQTLAGSKPRTAWSCRIASFAIGLLLLVGTGCSKGEKEGAGAHTLSATPAARLAYRFTADIEYRPTTPPQEAQKLKPIQDDFDARRKDDRLVRTVLSPDGMRALALYDTGDTKEGEFRIDMYSADGKFLRNLTPPELSGAFPSMVAWSPDGNYIAFIGRKSLAPEMPPGMIPETQAQQPLPEPSVAPAFAPVAVFDTEQVYLCNRDGFELRPLTTRNGLIYFYLSWAPDNHALVALACREDEWGVRESESKLPAGRPRLLETDGRERLLDDGLTEGGPVWSPDSSKIAAALEAEVKIYDAVGESPTQASVPLRDPLLKASVEYDEKKLQSKDKTSQDAGAEGPSGPSAGGTPISFNPIIRLNWPEGGRLVFQTAYIRIYSGEPVITFERWHKLDLSIQPASPATARTKGVVGPLARA